MKIFRILLIAILSLALPLNMSSKEQDTIIISEWPEFPDLSELGKLKDLSALSELNNLNISDYTPKYNISEQLNLYQNRKSSQKREPSRTEQKSFDKVSKINIFQCGGNVKIQESSGKKIDVTIQYFDLKNQKAACNIFTKNGELNIETTKSSTNQNYYVNYVISLPKNIAVDAKIEYGNIAVDKAQASYKLNASYGNVAIDQSDKETPDVTIKYGSLRMDNAKNVAVNAMYSKINIKTLQELSFDGKYNSIVLGKLNTIHLNKPSMYNKYKIEMINNLTATIKYDKLDIEKLIQDINLSSSYSKINIESISSKSRNIKIKGAYSGINLTLEESLSALVDAKISYGDLFISKKYNTKVISDNSDSFSVTKKVQIGNGSPSLSVNVSNSYSNINIK